MRFFRSRAGQIVIPAMLIFPTLFLFVYLIYETAKLSREKIKHQFAMDAAAFVEMTNYSDFLNRTAYVNGAFPMRIFVEGYSDFKAECEGKVAHCDQMTYASILYANGVFPYGPGPYPPGGTASASMFNGLTTWPIEYGGGGAFKQVDWPPPDQPTGPDGAWDLFTETNADNYWHPYDLATEIYKLYVQIYSLLGSVEDAQFQVLQRLTTQGSIQHTFLQKSYWLNTGDAIGDAAGLAANFSTAIGNFQTSVQPYCQQQLVYWGNKHLTGGIQPYVPQKTTPIVNLAATGGAGCSSADNGPGGGLFQVEYANPQEISLLKKGLELQMNWAIPSQNFFNVNFPALMAQKYPQGTLHTTISLGGDEAAAVWPDPTPKFQVRQFP